MLLKYGKIGLSKLYETIVKIRHYLYDKTIFKGNYFDYTKTISIGNISVGGTGKTPHVIKLIDHLKSIGKVSLISRGYKREGNGEVLIHDGKGLVGNSIEGGDEPYMIAKKCDIFTITNPDRSYSLDGSIRSFNPDFVVMDDGFQHRKVEKDINIVLIDSPRFLGNGNFIPDGILRDSVDRLNYCDIIILTKVYDDDKKDTQIEELRSYNKPTYYSKISPGVITNGDITINLEDLNPSEVTLFTGIAMKEPFIKIFGKEISEILTFNDHHRFTHKDLDKIINFSNNSRYIICTEKDYVNLPSHNIENLFYLEMDITLFNLDNEEINFGDILTPWIKR